MLQRLPKIPANLKFDPKNGWLPSSFTEQCREIVGKYIINAVHEEVRREQLMPRQEEGECSKNQDTEQAEDEEEPISYCSQMLSNIKKGIYKSVNFLPISEESSSQKAGAKGEVIDTVDLLDGKSAE